MAAGCCAAAGGHATGVPKQRAAFIAATATVTVRVFKFNVIRESCADIVGRGQHIARATTACAFGAWLVHWLVHA